MRDDVNRSNTVAQLDIPEDETSEVNPEELDAESFTATKKLIQNLSVKIDELKVKQKEYKERMKNLQVNDALLGEYEEKAKEAASEFKKRKKDLMESVEAKEVRAKLKELSEELGDLGDSLTNHLLNYYQVTRTQSFETHSGSEREFKLNAKLMPSKDS